MNVITGFFNLRELFGNFVLVLDEYIRRRTTGKNKRRHYLRENVQNEIIKIKNKMLSLLKAA